MAFMKNGWISWRTKGVDNPIKDEYLSQLGDFREAGRFLSAQMLLTAVAVSGATT